MSQQPKKMKVAILTLPLHVNYGGILQAFALFKTLQSMGCDVTIINYMKQYPSVGFKVKVVLKNIVKKIVFRRDVEEIVPYFKSKKSFAIYTENIRRFIKKHLNVSDEIFTERQLKAFCVDKFDAYVVGSDQVWRPCFAPCISNHFLRFLDGNSKVRRISYAASFGVDNWEYNLSQTSECRLLVQNFTALSVREDSAVRLCEKHFGVDAKHVLDPTLLLPKEDYLELLDTKKKSPGNLFAYILDKSKEKNEVVEIVKNELGLVRFTVKGKSLNRLARSNMHEFVAPSVEDWIMAFRDAEFVVTDSFHGCAFAIIFNKPFFAIGNKQRGLARFKSLLSIFGLEDRLIIRSDEIGDERVVDTINWERVNAILKRKHSSSINFLRSGLSL